MPKTSVASYLNFPPITLFDVLIGLHLLKGVSLFGNRSPNGLSQTTKRTLFNCFTR